MQNLSAGLRQNNGRLGVSLLIPGDITSVCTDVEETIMIRCYLTVITDSKKAKKSSKTLRSLRTQLTKTLIRYL